MERGEAVLSLTLASTPPLSDVKKGFPSFTDIQLNMAVSYHRQKIQSSHLSQKVFQKLSVVSGEFPDIEPFETVVVKTRKISENRVLLYLSVVHREPVAVLNTLIELYLEEYVEDLLGEQRRLLTGIEQRLSELENTIMEEELALFNIGGSAGIVPGEEASFEKLKEHTDALNDIQKKRAEISKRRGVIQRIERGESLEGYTLTEKEQALKKLYNELRGLSRKYKDAHPEIQRLKQKISTMSAFGAELPSLREGEAFHLKKIEEIRKKIIFKNRQESGHSKERARLEQSLRHSRKAYSELYEKYQKILSESFFNTTEIQVMMPPYVVVSDHWINGLLKLFKAIVVFSFVVLLFFTVIVALYKWDQRRKMVERHIPTLLIRTLGEITLSRKDRRRKDIHLLLYHQPEHQLCKELNRISDQLYIEFKRKNMKTILFTHLGKRAHQMNLSTNFGVAMAHRNKTVLIIDAFLNEPQLGPLFSFNKKEGLADLLLDETTLDQAIQTTEIPNLSALTAGSYHFGDFEPVASPSMKALLNTLESKFDLIIIHAPSCFENYDLFTLAQYSQGVILVQEEREKIKSMLSYASGVTREDIESLSWIGRVNIKI